MTYDVGILRDKLRDALRYNALSWSSGSPFVMEAAAPTPLRTMLSSSEPGVTKSLLFKSGRGFFEWLSSGNREGGFPPLLDKDSVSGSSGKRFSSAMEDEPSGNYRNTSQSSVIELTHDMHHLCTRFRTDGKKAISRGILISSVLGEYRE